MPPPIRAATPADWARIAELREEVGWSVRPWTLHAFRPPVGAAWVAEDAGQVVGCGSGIVHGRIGIVGNMVVTATHRRRGIAGRILREVLDFLEPRTDTIELNATLDGQPLYERFGFEAVTRFHGANLPPPAGAVSDLVVGEWTDAAALAAWDALRFGGNRLTILAMAVHDPGRSVLAARAASGELAGYAVVRPTEQAIGPFVADLPDAAAALLEAAARQASSVQRWRITLPGDNAVAIEWLRDRDIELQPHGMQMRLGIPPQRRIISIWGTGAGAIG
jgi:GNAT superfamily N-acetyltransferase